MKTIDKRQLQELAEFVYEWIFAAGKPYTHILVRDYARGIIETALQSGAQLSLDPLKVRPPYKSAWPKAIPTAAELKAKYAWHDQKMADAEWSRVSIYSSVMGFGDFARYVIGTNSGSFEWSGIRLGKRPIISPQDRYDAFLNDLSSRQRQVWEKLQNIQSQIAIARLAERLEKSPRHSRENVNAKSASESAVRKMQKTFESHLSPTQLRTYHKDVLTYLSNPHGEKDRFDLSVAQRWILQRVFDLGWSVEKFGTFDRNANRYLWSRDARKSERIGKKYQWIAYHEFLGLVADHFEFGNYLYDDSEKRYEGPWQMFVRDIDPSCTIRQIPGGNKFVDAWWSPQTAYNWDDSESGDSPWVSSTGDLPSVERLIEVSNPEDGSEWLALESYPEWEEGVPSFEERFEKPRRRLWYQITSYIVERRSAAQVFSWLSRQHYWGRWMPENPEHHTAFLGEFYWAPPFQRHEAFVDPQEYRSGSRLRSISSRLVFTSDTYYSEMNSFDCSAEERFRIFVPGAWLVEKMGLHWNGREGQFFDSTGQLVAFDAAVIYPGPNTLLVRKQEFVNFLRKEGYEVIWILLGAKQIIGGSMGRNDWKGELQVSGTYKVKAGKIWGKSRPKFIER
jgi:hypothetical protein